MHWVKEMTPIPITEGRLGALVRLCHALLPQDSSLAGEVILAARDPHTYYARFQEWLLDGRGVEEQDIIPAVQPWTALLDGLLFRHHLEQFDWREVPELVMEGINGLLQNQAAPLLPWDWVDIEHWRRVHTSDFLQTVGDRLLSQNRMLAQFYEDSDSYPVMIIDTEQLLELHRLARLSGYGDIQPLASTLPQDFQLP
jgi:hypothetical protein